MPVRWVLCAIVGSGTDDDPRKPIVANYVQDWAMQDGPAGDWALVRATGTVTQLQALDADPQAEVLPAATIDDLWGSLPALRRQRIATALSTHLGLNVTDGQPPLEPDRPVRQVLRAIGRRLAPGFLEGNLRAGPE
jgi:hypothetical protein